MRYLPAAGLALAAIAGAQLAGAAAEAVRPPELEDEPFAPTPETAPIATLGYRELATDIMYMRLIGYFGGNESTANGIASLVEAAVAIDPRDYRFYELGARAMTIAAHGVDQETYLRALRVLEKGAAMFPADWKLPYFAGLMYIEDLKTDDPAQRHKWDDRGALLIESAVRKPGASASAATLAAAIRSRLGQHQQAVANLHEMLLLTNDPAAQQRLLDKLAELEQTDAGELAAEIHEARRAFEQAWKSDRPAVPATMYILLGKPLRPGFDLVDLATGGRDLLGADDVQRDTAP